MADLNTRLTIPMAADDKTRLRRAAAELGISPGLLARALILVGLDSIGEPDVISRIEVEAEAATSRASAAGKAAMKSRWDKERAKQKRSGAGRAKAVSPDLEEENKS
ncbi:hypothetical protein JOF28_000299 [Leucobacter exalbidus]|uniref:Uncharacterized protein n=1 Tax=Leucobacter exalbidus TaxID=662960 RepID=A0A940T2H4_9MICO|nr:hypothetical protein [Leucobacter exalbidus]MBP1325067.1 hypothetical protein [Leucobacter exalbidus]